MNKILFSTGIFARNMQEEDIDKMIEILTHYNIDGIEILLARPRLTDLVLNTKKLSLIKELSIHAPFFKEEGYEDVRLDEPLLMRLNKFANMHKINSVVVHPDLIDNWEVLNQLNLEVEIETLKPYRNWNLEKMQNLLVKYPRFKVAFDTEHVKAWGDKDYEVWLSTLLPKITTVHLNFKDDYLSVLSGKWECPDFISENKNIKIVLETKPKKIEEIEVIIDCIKKSILKRN